MVASSIASLSSRPRKHPPRQSLLVAITLLTSPLATLWAVSWWRRRDDDLPTSRNSMKEIENSEATKTMEKNIYQSQHNNHNQQRWHSPEQRLIKYIPVTSGREGVQRYAAMAVATDESISVQEWLTMVSTDSPIGMRAASELSATIAASQYTSLLFETPGTSWLASATTPFEFVLVDEPALRVFAEGNPDRYAFTKHFNAALRQDNKSTVCSFTNLGGDATLVSPVPPSGDGHNNDASYSHLAIFVRTAPKSQVAEFWKLAATTYLGVLKKKQSVEESWFSTNGMGVAWLHLRIDDRPKYYSYAPFKLD